MDQEGASEEASELLDSILEVLPSHAAVAAAPARRRLRPLVAAAVLTGHDAATLVDYVRTSWPRETSPRSPAGLLTTLLRDAKESSPKRHRPDGRELGCPNCAEGWLATPDDDVAVPCPHCKPHTVRTHLPTAVEDARGRDEFVSLDASGDTSHAYEAGDVS
jgi:hypothetical protein